MGIYGMSMNNEDFCSYEQALALKKLGFREKCDYIYRFENNPLYSLEETIIRKEYCISWNNHIDCCSAPTLAQAQKWLREKGYSVEPILCSNKSYRCDGYRISDFKHIFYNIMNKSSYEEALSAGITECIKILEKECQN